MKRLLPLLFIVLAGCAHQRMQMDVPLSSMENDQLLAHYYSLQNASGNSDRGVAGMRSQYAADRFFGGPNQALGNVIVTGIIQGQGNAYRERAIDVRVELERRGWTPSKGLSEMAPTRYMSKTVFTTETQAAVQPNVVASSKYAYSAEKLAKANGCDSPASTINFKTPDSETFSITCAKGNPLSVRCENGQCRTLQ